MEEIPAQPRSEPEVVYLHKPWWGLERGGCFPPRSPRHL